MGPARLFPRLEHRSSIAPSPLAGEGWDGGSEGEGVGLYQDSRETPPFLTCTVTLTTPGMSAWKTVLAVPSRVRVRMGTKHIQTA